MSAARDEILGRIRAALSDVSATDRSEDVPMARSYRSLATDHHNDRVARFAQRVSEYRATVRPVSHPELPAAIATACQYHSVRTLVVPEDIPATWLPEKVTILRDGPTMPLSNGQLDSSDGVLTGCALAIAETGTIVLDGRAAQGRRVLTLLPDYHLCVVYSDQIVGLVPEAFSLLGQTVRSTGRPITLISGPSATSDIELNRVEGVHGPRTLEVLLVNHR